MGVNSFVAMVMEHKIFKARTVPFTLRAKVECELDRLARDGVLEKVPFCDWGAPIVAVRGLQSDSQPHRTVPPAEAGGHLSHLVRGAALHDTRPHAHLKPAPSQRRIAQVRHN